MKIRTVSMTFFANKIFIISINVILMSYCIYHASASNDKEQKPFWIIVS